LRQGTALTETPSSASTMPSSTRLTPPHRPSTASTAPMRPADGPLPPTTARPPEPSLRPAPKPHHAKGRIPRLTWTARSQSAGSGRTGPQDWRAKCSGGWKGS